MNDKQIEEIIEKTFTKYDKNKNGTLDISQIHNFLNDVYAQAGKKPSNPS